MRLPCPHLIALALKYKEINLLEAIRMRWTLINSSKECEETELVEFTKGFILKMNNEEGNIKIFKRFNFILRE